jgi:murein DD-endopeptidase MepM/ murein hydrolase activator NlpD
MREENLPLQPGLSSQEWGPGYEIWQSLHNLLAQRGPEGTTALVRMASHLVLVLVAVGVLAFSRLTLPGWDIVQVREETAQIEAEEAALALEAGESSAAESSAAEQELALERRAVPFTLIPERARTEIITHTVVAGDTLYALAKKYGVGAETLMWANNMEQNPDLLRLGQKLIVLPFNGVYHTVGAKDTLEAIAKKYKANVADIIAYEPNRLDLKNPVIHAGQKLVVPGGTKPVVVKQVKVYSGPVPASAAKGSGRFVWPTTGYITQGYKPLHRAIDIAGRVGLPVKASDAGYVVESGWSNAGYGYYIVVDHRNGFQTLYAHLSRILVGPGQSVGKGATIALMGSSGRSTGAHLHFEVRQGGSLRNPFGYLP